jgi:hypothetical protein
MQSTTRPSRTRGLACAPVLAALLAGACNSRVLVDGSGGMGGAGAQGGAGGAGATSSTSTTSTSSTSSTSTGTSTTSTSTTSTSTSIGGVVLGLPCADDTQCGGDGKCLTVGGNSVILGGGPANGYCSKACSSDADCPGPDGVCLSGANGEGECFLGCVYGEPPFMSLVDPLDPLKCHGREDLRCEELSFGSAVCLPTCGSDAECAGRFCDLQLAVCVDAPSTGKALGDKCDPMAMVDECAGVCIALVGDKTMCSSRCVMGGVVPNSFECGGTDQGVCIYSPAGTGLGDVAFCAQSCTQQDQCQVPDFFCFNVDLPDNGLCIYSDPCVSDADCAFLDAICVQTSLGQFCMSPQYPLGNL